MKIINVGMYVNDLEGAKEFFMTTFDAQIHDIYEEDNGFKSYILKFDEGPKLELMNKPEIVDIKKDRNQAGLIHICLKVDSLEKLNEVITKFKASGYEILYEPATVGGKEVRAITFEDNILEVSA